MPTSDRDVNAARDTYKQQPALECVWTGTVLRPDKFDVDHVIPFSLWHNNDLWNLVPASPAANRGWTEAVDRKLAELGLAPATR